MIDRAHGPNGPATAAHEGGHNYQCKIKNCVAGSQRRKPACARALAEIEGCPELWSTGVLNRAILFYSSLYLCYRINASREWIGTVDVLTANSTGL